MNPLARKLRTARGFSPETLRTFRVSLMWIPVAGGLIHALGFRRLERLVSRCLVPAQPAPASLPPREVMEAVETGFRLALKYAPYKGTCLSRSVLLRALMKAQGLEAALYVGVRKDLESLQAHAWVDAEGAGFGPDSVIETDFHRMPRLPASGALSDQGMR